MVLLYNVVGVLDLTTFDRYVSISIDPMHDRYIGSIFVHRVLLWITVLTNRPFEEPGRCCAVSLGLQQKIDGGAFLVKCTYRYFHAPPTLINVASMRQLPPAGRLCFRNIFPSNGRNRITQWMIVE